jgi:hypothetical protein
MFIAQWKIIVPKRKSTKNTSLLSPTHHLIGGLVIRCCQPDQQGQEVGEGGGRQAVLSLVPELGGDDLQGSLPYVGVLAAQQAAQRAQECGRGQQGQAALQHLFCLWVGKTNLRNLRSRHAVEAPNDKSSILQIYT